MRVKHEGVCVVRNRTKVSNTTAQPSLSWKINASPVVMACLSTDVMREQAGVVQATVTGVTVQSKAIHMRRR